MGEAQRVSDEIDDSIKAEKIALKKRKVLKMLLLGQAESGESLVLDIVLPVLPLARSVYPFACDVLT